MYVILLAEEQDCRAHAKDNRWQEVRQPEADVMLSVDHCQRTSQRADVNQQVKVDVDPSSGDSRINNLLLSMFVCSDIWPFILVLFSDEGRYVALETTGT